MTLKKIFRASPYLMRVIVKLILAPKYCFKIWKNDFTALMGRPPGGTRTIFVAGYPKSGTTWVENFISHIPGYNPRALYGDREVLRHHNLPEDAFVKIPKFGYSAIKTHVTPDAKNIDILIRSGVRKVLVMYRDPRDIVVSNYYHILKNNPWIPSDPFYANYSVMSKEEGISHALGMTLDDYIAWVSGWKAVAHDRQDIDCLFLKYEDLRNDPEEAFRGILEFFDVKLNNSQLNTVILASNKKSKKVFTTSLMPGNKSTKRKGIVGEWKEELNEKQKEIFKKKAGKFLIDLGYESGCEF